MSFELVSTSVCEAWSSTIHDYGTSRRKHGVPWSQGNAPAKDGGKHVEKKGGSMLNDFRQFVRDHRDMLFTIAFVLVLDEFVFKGALRERIKGVIEGALKRVEEKTGIDIPGV